MGTGVAIGSIWAAVCVVAVWAPTHLGWTLFAAIIATAIAG